MEVPVLGVTDMSPACWLGEHDSYAPYNWVSAIVPSEICDHDMVFIQKHTTMSGRLAFADLERHRDSTSFERDWTRSATWSSGKVWESV